jgi:hypothetical protein
MSFVKLLAIAKVKTIFGRGARFVTIINYLCSDSTPEKLQLILTAFTGFLKNRYWCVVPQPFALMLDLLFCFAIKRNDKTYFLFRRLDVVRALIEQCRTVLLFPISL